MLRCRYHEYRVQTLIAAPHELISDTPNPFLLPPCAVRAWDVMDKFWATLSGEFARATRPTGTRWKTEGSSRPPRYQPVRTCFVALPLISTLSTGQTVGE